MRAAILGGGGFRVPLIHRALLAARLELSELVLYDIEPGRLAVLEAVLADSPVPGVASTDLDAALDGAGLIFSAFRAGGTDGRVADERRALRLGLLGQETVGAGGLSAALRAVPVAMRIAERIARLAPDAWLITMTNPAGIVTQASATVLGERVVGVCDSPAGLIGRARRALDVAADASVQADYLGLNHLGWLRRLVVDGTDRLPDLLADDAALGSIEEGRLFGAELIRALGALPNEYLYYFYAAAEALAAVRAAGETRGEHVREQQHRFYAAATAHGADAARLWREANAERNASYFAELRAAGEDRDAVDVAEGGYETIAAATAVALTGGPPAELVLDVPNGTAIEGLPPEHVVEVPCRVDVTGVHALPVPAPDTHQLGLMCAVAASEAAILEAARTGAPEAALRAFALHPLIGSLDAARALAEAGP